jgi:hypothetical protein
LAAVAAAGGAFAQSTLTGELSYGFSSETAANSTLSGFGLEAADITIATTEDIEGLGKVAAAMNFDASGGRGSNATVNDVTLSLTMTSGMKITGGSTLGGNYLSQGLASAGSAYELNMSNKIFSKRTANDFVSVSMPLMEGTKLTYTRNEGAGDVTIGSGSASALGTSTQSNDTISLDYAAGALAVNVQARNYNQQIASSTSSAQTRSRAAASYDLGVAKIGAGVENTNYTYGNTKSDSVFGLTIPMGAANIGGQVVSSVTSGGTSNYSRSGALFGGTYNLSKRTYAVAQYYSYDAGSTVSNTSGYILALYNTF